MGVGGRVVGRALAAEVVVVVAILNWIQLVHPSGKTWGGASGQQLRFGWENIIIIIIIIIFIMCNYKRTKHGKLVC